ncbi:MAG: molecular chaperone DnaJ, partial [Leptolyngbya sp. SIO3F4]|nr:molecular chaperone DnaJ [Leptolyngbya sp. SIO3F4]
VRVQGEGEPPSPDISPEGQGVRGDLHVVVRVKEHELYEREGDHLLFEMPIGFSQAALGAEIEVPTLEGKHTLKIPSSTQHGAIFRIRGEGTPNLRSGSRGDLIVVTKIEIPKKLSKQQEKILREFAETEDKSVLPESHGFLDKIRDMLGG